LKAKLGENKLESYHKIKNKVFQVEQQASKIESIQLDSLVPKNLIKNTEKVASMYVDAIKAKASLIDQL